jgi:hypothetical protein
LVLVRLVISFCNFSICCLYSSIKRSSCWDTGSTCFCFFSSSFSSKPSNCLSVLFFVF